MQRIAASLLVALTWASVAGCRRPTQAVIVVDAAHAQIGQAEGLKYSSPPAQQLLVDARGFDFSKSLFPAISPNAVQLVLDEQRQFTAPWDPSGQTTLSAATLSSLKGGLPFDGLRSGDTAIVAIGEQRVDEAKGELGLKVLWVGLLEVK
jgi:hypothetical protein